MVTFGDGNQAGVKWKTHGRKENNLKHSPFGSFWQWGVDNRVLE